MISKARILLMLLLFRCSELFINTKGSFSDVPQYFKALVRSGGNVDAADNGGWTALMWAASNNNIEVMKVGFVAEICTLFTRSSTLVKHLHLDEALSIVTNCLVIRFYSCRCC